MELVSLDIAPDGALSMPAYIPPSSAGDQEVPPGRERVGRESRERERVERERAEREREWRERVERERQRDRETETVCGGGPVHACQ